MPYDDVTFTREKLYEEVWTRPVTQLAKEIGISDVALAKICRKLNVPVPARGYWARVAAGHPPKKPALRTAAPPTPQTHVFRRWRAPEWAVAPAVTEDRAPSITVAPTLENPHRMIRTSRAHLQRTSKEYDSRVRPKDQVLDIAVSEAALNRALRVMDAVLKALEERGHRVEVRESKPPHAEPSHYGKQIPQPEPRWHTFAVVENTAVEFGLEESYETIEVPPPPPSGLRETRSWNLPRPVKERIPNGRLLLTIRNAPRSERITCGDTKRQAIEARLGSFILLLEATSAAIRAAKVEAARQAEERRRWQEEHQKAEDRRRREEALVRDLDQRLDLWLSAARYRQLADAVWIGSAWTSCPNRAMLSFTNIPTELSAGRRRRSSAVAAAAGNEALHEVRTPATVAAFLQEAPQSGRARFVVQALRCGIHSSLPLSGARSPPECSALSHRSSPDKGTRGPPTLRGAGRPRSRAVRPRRERLPFGPLGRAEALAKKRRPFGEGTGEWPRGSPRLDVGPLRR